MPGALGIGIDTSVTPSGGEMDLDSLAALAPPTPADGGLWPWPRSCRTPGTNLLSEISLGATGFTPKAGMGKQLKQQQADADASAMAATAAARRAPHANGIQKEDSFNLDLEACSGGGGAKKAAGKGEMKKEDSFNLDDALSLFSPRSLEAFGATPQGAGQPQQLSNAPMPGKLSSNGGFPLPTRRSPRKGTGIVSNGKAPSPAVQQPETPGLSGPLNALKLKAAGPGVAGKKNPSPQGVDAACDAGGVFA